MDFWGEGVNIRRRGKKSMYLILLAVERVVLMQVISHKMEGWNGGASKRNRKSPLSASTPLSRRSHCKSFELRTSLSRTMTPRPHPGDAAPLEATKKTSTYMNHLSQVSSAPHIPLNTSPLHQGITTLTAMILLLTFLSLSFKSFFSTFASTSPSTFGTGFT
jgi:hypothetical protein